MPRTIACEGTDSMCKKEVGSDPPNIFTYSSRFSWVKKLSSIIIGS